METLTPRLTHPESAWLVELGPLCLVLALLLTILALMRGQLVRWIADRLSQQLMRTGATTINPALRFQPQIATPEQIVTRGMVALIVTFLIASRLTPLFLTTILSCAFLPVFFWVELWTLEARYIRRLQQQLIPFTRRLTALLHSAKGIEEVLYQLIDELIDGPLKQELQWVLDHMRTPLRDGPAGLNATLGALAAQTPSRWMAMLLIQLQAGLGQSKPDLLARLMAVGEAFSTTQDRGRQARKQLAHIKSTGWIVGGLSLFMNGYFFLTHPSKFVAAYSGMIGTVAAIVVLSCILAPIIGAAWLSRTPDPVI